MQQVDRLVVLYAAGGKIDGKLCCRWKDQCNVILVTREIAVFYTAGRKIDGFYMVLVERLMANYAVVGKIIAT